jgi:hypothetical protein
MCQGIVVRCFVLYLNAVINAPKIKSKMIKKISSAVLVSATLFLSACASQNHGAALIESQPEGAEVVNTKSGTILGVTPVKVSWREDGESRLFVNIRVQKLGYQDKTNSFWVTLRYKNREDALADPQSVKMILDEKVN